MTILPFRCANGHLEPTTPEGEAVLLGKEGQVIRVELLTPKRFRSIIQNRYWWGVIVPTIQSCWHSTNPGRTFTPEVVHGALVQAKYGKVWTPLGPERVSSATLTVEEFTELIEWARDYALEEFKCHIPEAHEVME